MFSKDGLVTGTYTARGGLTHLWEVSAVGKLDMTRFPELSYHFWLFGKDILLV